MARIFKNIAYGGHFPRTSFGGISRPVDLARSATIVGLVLVSLAGWAQADVSEQPETLVATTSYDLDLAIVSASGEVGAVQFDVVYTGESGGFAPTFNGTRGACQISITNAFGVSNVREDGRITVGIAGVPGFETPVNLANCKFSATAAVDPADFKIVVVDVIDSTGAYMRRPPEIRVTKVTVEDSVGEKFSRSTENNEIERLVANLSD